MNGIARADGMGARLFYTPLRFAGGASKSGLVGKAADTSVEACSEAGPTFLAQRTDEHRRVEPRSRASAYVSTILSTEYG